MNYDSTFLSGLFAVNICTLSVTDGAIDCSTVMLRSWREKAHYIEMHLKEQKKSLTLYWLEIRINSESR